MSDILTQYMQYMHAVIQQVGEIKKFYENKQFMPDAAISMFDVSNRNRSWIHRKTEEILKKLQDGSQS